MFHNTNLTAEIIYFVIHLIYLANASSTMINDKEFSIEPSCNPILNWKGSRNPWNTNSTNDLV